MEKARPPKFRRAGFSRPRGIAARAHFLFKNHIKKARSANGHLSFYGLHYHNVVFFEYLFKFLGEVVVGYKNVDVL